jgi:Zn-dependent protease with chaperone function
MSETRADRLKPRLNPLAFPSDTGLRFALLIVFAISTAVSSFNDFWVIFYNNEDQSITACFARISAELPNLRTPQDYDNFIARAWTELWPKFADCARLMQPAAICSLVGVSFTIGLALALYWAHPYWKIRSQKLLPFTAQDAPGLLDELHRLCGEARLHPSPLFVWNPNGCDPPSAFGTFRRRYIALSGSFVVYGQRSGFCAVMLHEFAHIQNRDIDKTYLTIAICLAAFGASVSCAAILLIFGPLAKSGAFLGSTVIRNLLVLLAGLAVLRSREHYADVRASVSENGLSSVDLALRNLPPAANATWRQYVSFHPTPARRRLMLADPSRLFHLGLLDAFGVGVAAQLSSVPIGTVALPFAARLSSPMFVAFLIVNLMVVPAVIFSLAVGVLAISVWRGAFSALLSAEGPYRRTGSLAIALICGYVCAITWGNLSEIWWGHAQIYTAQFFVPMIAIQSSTAILWLLATFVTFRWIPAHASAWLDIVVAWPSPRHVLVTSVIAAVLLVSASFVLAFFMATVLIVLPRPDLLPLVYLFGLYALFVATVAWTLPLSAQLWRRSVRAASVAPWVFLDGFVGRVPDRGPFRLGRVACAGALAGLGFCLAWELVYFHRHLPFGTGEWVFAAFAWSVKTTHTAFGPIFVTGVIAQALAATAGAIRASRSILFCGLFAAFVCAFVVVTWNFVFFYAGDVDYYSWAVEPLALVMFGTLLAFPAIFLALPLRRLVYGRECSAAARSVHSWTTASAAAILALIVCIAAGIKAIQAVLP